MRRLLLALLAVLALAIPVAPLQAAELRDRLAGRILLDVANYGAAWYVDPVARERLSLGRPDAALAVMRRVGLGITDANLALIPVAGADGIPGALAARLAGRILLQVEAHGEAWYVDPLTGRRHFLGRPADALRVMSALGLGISVADLALIPVAADAVPPLAGAAYEEKNVVTSNGTYAAKVAAFDRSAYELQTVTAQTGDCAGDCAAFPLLDLFNRVPDAVAAIHGSYFCPPDYTDCATKKYSYLWPFMDSPTRTLVNEANLKYHERPFAVAFADGSLRLFRNAKLDFGRSLAGYEALSGKIVTAAVGNYPTLLADGRTVAIEEPTLDAGQRDNKGRRGALGWNAEKIFLVVAEAATVPDLAAVMQALGATDALNLDGGGSSALVWRGEYKVGPGRLLPNAVIIKQK